MLRSESHVLQIGSEFNVYCVIATHPVWPFSQKLNDIRPLSASLVASK